MADDLSISNSQQQQQKLFRLPGTIEEEDCDHHLQDDQLLMQNQRSSRPESPLLSPRSNTSSNNNNVQIVSSIPKNVTLLRVSTQSSSIVGITRQDSTRSRYRAGPARKLRRRAVLKSGECNVLQSRISRRSLRFLQDIFTTLVDTQWRWTLLCFALSFVLSWLVFAGIWYLIAFTHGDFDPRHLANPDWRPCVSELHSFTSCFLFSIETQHTIGYGGRATTEECPEAIFVMCAQSISGVMIQALMVGIVFAKMSRPKQRTQTLLFSKQAVICQRDGELCLMFRVGDMRKSHIIGATVRAQLIRSRTTKEGEVLAHNQHELAVGADGQSENLFFIWPCTVVHRINADSPFYNMSAEDVLTERFEIVVILEGTIESTGQTTQARSSYLPQEVLWGHRFEPLVSYSKERQGYEVDYSRFNSTVQVDTPLCSGRELAEFYRLQDGLRQQQASPSGTYLLDEDLGSEAGRFNKYLQPPPTTMTPSPSPRHHLTNLRNLNQSHSPSPSVQRRCADCSGPPPYGQRSKDNEDDRQSVAPLTPHLNNHDDDKSLERRTRFRSCQDLLQRPNNSSKRYLLLALDNSNNSDNEQFSSSSYPSVVVPPKRRHTGSKERLNTMRKDKLLKEIVVQSDDNSTTSQLPEPSGMPERVVVCCNGGSEASCETNSCCCSSNSSSEAENEEPKHQQQQKQRPGTLFTSV